LIEERDTASYAVQRLEHYRELGDIDYEDLGVLLAADVEEPEDGDPYPVAEVHARDHGADWDFDFDARIEFEGMDWETFRDVEYPTWVKVFEDEYGDSEANLQYWEPEDY